MTTYTIRLNWIKKYDVFVMDLDNTLYDESLYLNAAYFEISRWLNKKFGLDEALIFEYLTGQFKEKGRRYLFDNMETHFRIKPTAITEYLKILRTLKVPDKIPLLPPFEKLLTYLYSINKRLAILTNGNPEQQKNKVKHIDWPVPADQILFVYANEIEPKPSPAGLTYIKSHFNESLQIVFIGDSETDREAAVSAHVDYIDISDPLIRGFSQLE
jgi:HAD superfamily hydrolase (TIGR01549 family)